MNQLTGRALETALEELFLAGKALQRGGEGSTRLGVYVSLAWWLGVRDLREQFIPASAAFEQLRTG